MKLKEVKEFLSTLSEEQLEGELIVMGRYFDSVILSMKPSESNLYYLGDDDPSELLNETEMLKRHLEEGNDIDSMPKPYIKKGEIIMHC